MRRNKHRCARATRWMIFGGAILLCSLLASAGASAIEGLPGSSWGLLSYDVDSLVGSGAMGWINQGIDWVKLPGGLMLNTFTEFRYRFRTENAQYYNAFGPAVGIELRKSPFHFGIDYYWERYPELGQNDDKFQFYLTYYYEWDLRNLTKH